MYPEFMQDIERMNNMFELPVNKSITPDKDLADKLIKFHKTLSDEVNEILDISNMLDQPEYIAGTPYYPIVTIDHYVSLADLLGDVIVYCASEAMKHGIPIDDVLFAIMESQWSKLGANGEIIKDSNGKFLKGPNYEPPEVEIKRILQEQNRTETLSNKHRIQQHPRDSSYEIIAEDYDDYDNLNRS